MYHTVAIMFFQTTPWQTSQNSLQECKMQTILFFRSKIRIPSHWSTPKAKPETASLTTNRKWHWNVQFGICSSPGIFCYLMSKVLSGLNFLLPISWEHINIQHFMKRTSTTSGIIFNCLKLANLKIKLSKCQFFSNSMCTI